MSYTVVYSLRARIEAITILEYLEKNWSKREVKKFNNRLLDAVKIIAKDPFIYPKSAKKGIHKFYLDKHNSIYYLVRKDEIVILSIWTGKRNPKKLKL